MSGAPVVRNALNQRPKPLSGYGPHRMPEGIPLYKLQFHNRMITPS